MKQDDFAFKTIIITWYVPEPKIVES